MKGGEAAAALFSRKAGEHSGHSWILSKGKQLRAFGQMPFYFLNTIQLCDQGTGRPKSDTTLPSASLYQE